jgi:DNA-binding SARP family transcriptional activator
LAVDTRKAIALASYLAVEDHPPSRDELVDLLWPELDSERGRAALRRTLSTLRTAISGNRELVAANRDRITLDRSQYWLDIDQARQLALIEHSHGAGNVCPECIAPLGAATELYRGPFMHGFYLRDSPPFEDWQRQQTELHLRDWRDLVDRWALALASAGRFAEASSVIRRRLDADPLDEAAHRRLMLYLVWDGDRVGALRQYRECAMRLDQELGVPPLAETRELHEEILEGVEPLPPAGKVQVAPLVRPTAVGERWESASVGRKEELASMVAASGHIFLEGDEGIGKTDLIDRFRIEVGLRVAECAPPPGTEDVAYLAMRDALQSAIDSRPRGTSIPAPPAVASEAVRLLPDLAEAVFLLPPEFDEGPGAAARLHTGVAVALEYLVGDGWLIVDDAQWLDPSSVAVLGQLLGRGHLKILLAWRTGQLPHPLADLTRKLERSGMALRIRLAELSEEEAWELCRSRAAPGTSSQELESIVERSQGNPLFLLAYLAAVGSDRAELPLDIEDLIGARLDRLSEQALQVVSAGAVIGSEFDLDELRMVSGRASEEMVPALEELLEQRLVEEKDRIAFTHDAARRAVCKRLSKARLRILHSRAAERPRLPASLRAVHLEAAGRITEAAMAHAEAGLEAAAIHAYESAQSHLAAALNLGHPDRAELGAVLGEAHMRVGDYGAALAAYEVIPEDAEIAHRVGEIYMRLGRFELAAASWEQAAQLDPAPALDSRITADRALVAHRRGLQQEAARLIGQATREAERAGDLVALARSAAIEGMIKPSIARLEKAHSQALASGRSDLIAAALNNLALAQRRAGKLADSVANARKAIELLEPLGDRHQLAALHNNLADTLHRVGDRTGAESHLATSAGLFSSVGLEPGGWEPEVWMLSEW